MPSYHLSPKTRDYALCTAKAGNCAYSSKNHISDEGYKALKSGKAFDRENNSSEEVKLKGYEASREDSLKVAPEGLTGVWCFNCKKYFSNDFTQKLLDADSKVENRCPNCNDRVALEDSGVDIRSNEAKFLDVKAVRDASWFHVTTTEDWLDKMEDKGIDYEEDMPLLHIGSREAAMDRLRDLMRWRDTSRDGATWYLYELKVKPEAKIQQGIFADENDDCPSTAGDAEGTTYDGNGVNRYVNTYEAPGTVSLVANPKALNQVQCVVIPLDD